MSSVSFKQNTNGRPMKSSSTWWSNLKQQNLPAWQPVYTAKSISPIFLAFGVLLIPFGVVVFLVSNNIQEISINYTDCVSIESNSERCSDVIKGGAKNCSCVIEFEIDKDFEGDVYIYYALTNFYQNHREYVESRDDNQLLGDIGTIESPIYPSKDCQPFDKDSEGQFVIPCGAIANSMFNDSIKLHLHDTSSSTKIDVDLIRTGIAWESDKKYKFKNPEIFSNPDDPLWDKFTTPRDWNRTLWDLDPSNSDNNGMQNEDFIVWMRTAALPNFRKLHRIVNSKSIGQDGGLRRGNYSLEIQYEYEVKSFGGTKSIIISETSSLIGGRNSTLGIMFMSAGSVIMFVGILFLFAYVNRRNTWSQEERNGHKDYGTHKTTTVLRDLTKYNEDDNDGDT